MKLKKSFHIGGLSWAKVLSIALFFVVLLYSNGKTGKALIEEGSNPLGIETIGDALRTPAMDRGRATPETLRNDRTFISLPSALKIRTPQAARLLAGLASDIVAEGPLLNGSGTGGLYLPLIHKDFDPAFYAIVPYLQGLTQSEAEVPTLRPSPLWELLPRAPAPRSRPGR